MQHNWFQNINFDSINQLQAKAPFIPDKMVDYIEEEFIERDVKYANQQSPINSDEEYGDDELLANFDYE